jgi:phosphoribosylglycinamide formyltransferase-1
MKNAAPRIAIFASGFGSNLQAVLDSTRKGALNASVALVVSDKKDAFALTRAKEAGIEAIHMSPKTFATREEYDAALADLVERKEIAWVVLAGFMRILSAAFVRPLLGRIINIHPALLPAYPGTHSIARAYEAREKRIGVSVHFVDEGIDTGPIIAQDAIDVSEGESLESVEKRVHELEHSMYPRALAEVFAGKIQFARKAK